MSFAPADLTQDRFLGGRIRLWQPRAGYRAGVDPILLAASVPARPGDTVLDLGCGVGAVALAVAARVAGVRVTGVEVQADYAALARRNAFDNTLDVAVETADLRALPSQLRQRQFDHVVMNPPYFEPAGRHAAQDAGREVAFAGDTPLADWLEIAARRVAPGGTVSVVQSAARLPDLLAGCAGRLGSVAVLPVTGRAGRGADRVILRARKGGRAPFCLLSPLVLHEGATHSGDGDSYRAEITRILRDGAALDWPG